MTGLLYFALYVGYFKEEEKEVMNIGVVVYTKGESPGTLNAVWCHSDGVGGIGVATGGPAEGFAGEYIIKYFDGGGNFQAQRDLKIQKQGSQYTLAWIKDGKTTARGIGMETAEGLTAGYRDDI